MADKNQIMPPLLPLEYCTVDRAARLLNCEVEDIYHWQQIGAIEFYCHYNGMAKLSVEQIITDDDGDLASEYIDLENQLAGGWEEQVRKILSHMRTSYSWFSVKEFIPNPIFPYEVITEYGIDDELADASVQIDIPEWYEQSVLNPENEIFIKCSGYWKLDYSFIEEATDDGIDCTFLHYHRTPEIDGLLREWQAMMRIYDLDIHIPKKQYPHSLYLIKSDLQKIYRATHGLEELQTIYNNSNRYKELILNNESQSDEPPKRVRSEQVVLMQELVKRVLGVDTIDMPSKQAEALLAELSSSVPAEELPSARTVSRYLGSK
jgi:hypothetical protein